MRVQDIAAKLSSARALLIARKPLSNLGAKPAPIISMHKRGQVVPYKPADDWRLRTSQL